jgi:tryptophan-rich sensory protein
MHVPILTGTALATATAGVAGSIASKRGVRTWYPDLEKPRYVPPNGVFPVAWTTLYADIALTSALTINRLRTAGDRAGYRKYAAALGANLLLNAGWSWLFFRQHKLGAAAITAAALAVTGADLARRTAQVNRVAGLALAAYPAWCTFATALSTDIWRMNSRRALGV